MSAPIPPNNATSHIELAAASSKSTTPAGATVNIDTKNIPAIKLPNIVHSCVLVRIPAKVPVFARIMATTMLRATTPKSRIMLFFSLCIFISLYPSPKVLALYIRIHKVILTPQVLIDLFLFDPTTLYQKLLNKISEEMFIYRGGPRDCRRFPCRHVSHFGMFCPVVDDLKSAQLPKSSENILWSTRGEFRFIPG